MDTTILQQRLAQAETLCLQRNVRLTPQRHKVLRLMLSQQSAISAYDLLDLLRELEPQAKPPTVYRALEFLMEQGFIHKVESTNSYVPCHLFDQATHTSAMLICDHCGTVTEKSASGVEKILQRLAMDEGFRLQHNIVEAHGLCLHCREIVDCATPDTCTHDHHIDHSKKRWRVS